MRKKVMKLYVLWMLMLINQCFKKGNIKMVMNVKHRQKTHKTRKFSVNSQYGMEALKINNQNLVGNSGERRENYYGSVNLDPKVFKSMMGEGITSDYGQMLMDPSRYLISQGLKKTKNDIKNDILLGIKPDPARAKGLKYSYGEIDDSEKDEQAVFTHSYDEMLTNPKKKVLVLGVHPELITNNTRQLATELEDPEIIETQEDLQEKQNRQKEVEQKVQKIKSFLDLIQNEFKSGEVVNDRQKQILEQLNQYLQSDDEQIPLYKQFKEQVNSFVKQQLQGTDCKDDKNRFRKIDMSQIGKIGQRGEILKRESEKVGMQGMVLQPGTVDNKLALKGVQPSLSQKLPTDINEMSDKVLQQHIQNNIKQYIKDNQINNEKKNDVQSVDKSQQVDVGKKTDVKATQQNAVVQQDGVNEDQKNKIINQIQSLYSGLSKNSNNKENIIGKDILKNIQNVDTSQIKKLINSIDSIDQKGSQDQQSDKKQNEKSQSKYIVTEDKQQVQHETINQDQLQKQIDDLQVKIKSNLIHIQEIDLSKNYNNQTASLVNNLMSENQQLLNLQQRLLKQKQFNDYYQSKKDEQEQQMKQQSKIEKNLAINNSRKLQKKFQIKNDEQPDQNMKVQIQDLKNMIAKLENSNRRKMKLRKRR